MKRQVPKRIHDVRRTKPPEALDALPALPARGQSRFGKVDITQDKWVVSRNRHGTLVNFPVSRLTMPFARGHEVGGDVRESMFTATLVHAIKLFLVHELSRTAPLTAFGKLAAFFDFERYLYDQYFLRSGAKSYGIESLSATDIDAWRRHLTATRSDKAKRAGHIRLFYSYGIYNGWPGFNTEVWRRIKRMPCQTSLSGHVTREHHPTQSAFSWEERAAIAGALARNAGTLEQRALVRLFQDTGIRTEEAVLLTNADLIIWRGVSGPEYGLRLPKGKRPGGAHPNNVRSWGISTLCGEALVAIQETYGRTPTEMLLGWLIDVSQPHSKIREQLKEWADVADLSTTRVPPRVKVRRLASPISTASQMDQSQRRPDPTNPAAWPLTRLNMFPYRFRRTLATNLAEMGATAAEIAAALGDDTLAMAVVYTANTSLIVDVLAATLDHHPHWLHIIRLFTGDLTENSTIAEQTRVRAILGGAPQLAGYDRFMDIGPLGFCTAKSCTCLLPLGAYQCERFRAVADSAIHERQLDQVYLEIQRGERTESDRIALLLQRTAGAILQLLDRINERRGGIRSVIMRIASTRIGGLASGEDAHEQR